MLRTKYLVPPVLEKEKVERDIYLPQVNGRIVDLAKNGLGHASLKIILLN